MMEPEERVFSVGAVNLQSKQPDLDHSLHTHLRPLTELADLFLLNFLLSLPLHQSLFSVQTTAAYFFHVLLQCISLYMQLMQLLQLWHLSF